MELNDKPNILYVDDEPDNLLVFKAAFRRNYTIFTAESGPDGLDILQHQAIDLIITDQRMPDMTGIEFLKLIPQLPITIRMILTGYSDVQAVIEAINTGNVYRYITKPWDKDELKMTIDTAIEALNLKRKNESLIQELKAANQELEEKVRQRTAEIQLQKDEIEKSRQKIEDSIHYAKRIQTAILPDQEFIQAHFPEIGIFYQPKDIVSGDFYWMYAKPGIRIISSIDCTGHGVPGAFMSVVGYTLLNQIVSESNIHSPANILAELEIRIRETLKQGEKGMSQVGMVLSILTIWEEKQTIEFAGAHRPILHWNGKELTLHRGNSIAIGGEYVASKEFSQHQFPYQVNDRYYMWSDGLTDQFGGPNGRKFGNPQSQELLQQTMHLSVYEQIQQVKAAFEAWIENRTQLDDITLIGFAI